MEATKYGSLKLFTKSHSALYGNERTSKIMSLWLYDIKLWLYDNSLKLRANVTKYKVFLTKITY